MTSGAEERNTELMICVLQHLYERSWYAITESLLAMTIFRDEFGANFVLLFGTLLFLKVFHWLSADRVEFMEQSPSVSRLFHVRMVSVLWTLFGLDFFLVAFAVEVLILDKNRMGIMIMFASEFMILTTTLLSTFAKYIINVQDMRSEEPWEAKSMWVFFVDLITDFLKLLTYVIFLALILSFYNLPLNIIRDVYMTARSFFGRLRDFIKYRAATKNMDTRFPDATRQDLSATSDGTCIICREEMTPRVDEQAGDDQSATGASVSASRRETGGGGGLNETPKKLPCGHIFHFHCLRSWLERQQSCPTCRRTVFASPEAQLRDAEVNEHPRGPAAQPHAAATANVRPDNNAQAGNVPSANATQTARDRLQGFLQQLQTDAARVRDHANQHTPRAGSDPSTQETAVQATPATPAANSATSSSQPTPGQASTENLSSQRGRAPVQRALISSLFAQSDTDAERRAPGETATPLPQLSTPTRTDPREDLISSLVPPAPWTLKPSKTVTAQEQADVAGTAQSSEAAPHGKSAACPSTATKEAGESVEAIDPADAREAARAAALRRFESRSSGNAMSASAQIASVNPSKLDSDDTKGQQNGRASATESERTTLPGEPQLIPLFDPATIADYEIAFAPHLPFPLVHSAAVGHGAVGAAARGNSSLDELATAESLLQSSPEQLRSLSQRNRRGLEERLRLLTRVEGAIGGLVEELTRALSVIPSSDDMEGEDDGMDETEQERRLKKGKEAAEGVHAASGNGV